MSSAFAIVNAGFRASRGVLLWFGVVGFGYAWLATALYKSFGTNLDFTTLMAAYPKELQVAVGLPKETDLTGGFPYSSWISVEFFLWYAWALMVYGLLSARRAALCIADFGDKTTPTRLTARHGYFRLRDEGYERADLERWASAILEHRGEWDEVFVYFKHEEEGKGPEFARAFMEIVAALPM